MKLRNISRMLAGLFVICILIKFLSLLHPYVPFHTSCAFWCRSYFPYVPILQSLHVLPIPFPNVPLRQPFHAPYMPFPYPSVHLMCPIMPICTHSGPLTCPSVIPYVLGPNPSFSMTPARNGSTRTSAEEQSLFTILIPSG